MRSPAVSTSAPGPWGRTWSTFSGSLASEPARRLLPSHFGKVLSSYRPDPAAAAALNPEAVARDRPRAPVAGAVAPHLRQPRPAPREVAPHRALRRHRGR